MWLMGHAPRATKDPSLRQSFDQVFGLKMLYGSLMECPQELGCFELRKETPYLMELRVDADNWPGPRAPLASRNFPTTRRILRRKIDLKAPMDDVNAWFLASGVELGPLVPASLQEEVKRTLWTYRDLGAGSVADIPPTDLYTHKPRMKPGVEAWNRSPCRRWTEAQVYWLGRLVGEGIASHLYEYTASANGSLSNWAAEPVLVAKDLEDPWAEPRLTFNYSHVDEEMPGT
ncbi:hypothetical protein G7046_g8047 [Stylonectria norvegica]|nr:hypothetical protein G7046_g8047 [Stylonectria norvegica]